MGVFLGAQAAGGAASHVVGAGFLHDVPAVVENLRLADDLDLDGLLDVGKRVHVLELDARSQRSVVVLAQAHVGVAAEVAFFHVAVAHAQVFHDLLESLQIQDRFGNGTHVGTCHHFAQRRAAAVGVEQRIRTAVVDQLAGVLFHVDADDLDVAVHPFAHQVHVAAHADGTVVDGHAAGLGDLVTLGEVRVEVVLAREQGVGVNPATQREPEADGVLHGLGIGNR